MRPEGIVMFSGGATSWSTARRALRAGHEHLTLLFADVKMEDEDLYRFIEEAADNVQVEGAKLGVEVEWVKVAEGRDPWEVFFDERLLGNTQKDPCSRALKRRLLRRWITDHREVEDSVVYLGFDWTEAHRVDGGRAHWAPWETAYPLLEPPLLLKADHLAALERRGIKPPRLYGMGFPHNNCGGFCIKAGQAHFALLLEKMPERYAYHEAKEQELRDYLGKDVAILRDRRGGTTKPLTLRALRERIQGGGKATADWGGCGCFVPAPDTQLSLAGAAA